MPVERQQRAQFVSPLWAFIITMAIYKCHRCKREIQVLFCCEMWCDCKPRIKNKMKYEPTKQELGEEVKLNMRYVKW